MRTSAATPAAPPGPAREPGCTAEASTYPTYRRTRAELVIEGLDDAADVLLDGTSLGRHESQFVPARFEVTDLLAAGRRHHLAVALGPLSGGAAPIRRGQTAGGGRAEEER